MVSGPRRVPNVKTLELGLTPTGPRARSTHRIDGCTCSAQWRHYYCPETVRTSSGGRRPLGIERVVDFLRVRSIESEVAVTQEVDPVETLVLPTGYFTLIPEPIAWELGNLVVVLADTALNRLVEPLN
jgi:hypothetical protein